MKRGAGPRLRYQDFGGPAVSRFSKAGANWVEFGESNSGTEGTFDPILEVNDAPEVSWSDAKEP
jgi:hypothetical protein